MIVWHGKGIIVAIAAAVCLLALDGLTARYFHDSSFYATHGWPKLAGFLTAAAIVWVLSFRRKPDESIGAEEEPPHYPFLGDEDRLFFIPAKYWPVILSVLGIAFFFVRD